MCNTQEVTDNSDPLLTKLTLHHNSLLSEAENILTERLSAEVLDIIGDVSIVEYVCRIFTWSKKDELWLNALNVQAKNLQTPIK